MGDGGGFGWHFTEQGTFPYYCIPHCEGLDMVGSVQVDEQNTLIDETTWGKIRSLYR